eukprot:GGOE01022471.1.p2 GENE.GGOE01022471.1~~GGOE01022471.1.p2  ORF type:complete len:110 (-),score=11.04 GGOE01022471.1:119-448(-)
MILYSADLHLTTPTPFAPRLSLPLWLGSPKPSKPFARHFPPAGQSRTPPAGAYMPGCWLPISAAIYPPADLPSPSLPLTVPTEACRWDAMVMGGGCSFHQHPFTIHLSI